jgi:hypothetical protein
VMDDGIRQCHTQVCRGVRRRSVLQKSVTCYCVKELTIKFNYLRLHRYARTGNCNMGEFKDENGTVDWLTPMLEDVRF